MACDRLDWSFINVLPALHTYHFALVQYPRVFVIIVIVVSISIAIIILLVLRTLGWEANTIDEYSSSKQPTPESAREESVVNSGPHLLVVPVAV